MGRFAGFFGLLALMATVAGGQLRAPRPIDPTIYRSPSGQMSLYVNPLDKVGHGPCTVSLSQSGHLTWQKKLPYTLRGAMVDDRGRIAAWGYDGEPDMGFGKSSIHILFLAPSGRLLRDEVTPRDVLTGATDMPLMPIVEHFIGDPSGECVYAVFGSWSIQEPTTEWRRYDLRTGSL